MLRQRRLTLTNYLGLIKRNKERFENEILYLFTENVVTIVKHRLKASINFKKVGSSGEEQTIETSSVALKIT